MGGRGCVELAIHLPFYLQVFRGVFLHVVRVTYRPRQGRGGAYAAGDDNGGLLDQPELLQFP